MSISELLFLKIKEKAALQMATHPYAAFSRSEFISIIKKECCSTDKLYLPDSIPFWSEFISITWGVNDIGRITKSYSVNSVV